MECTYCREPAVVRLVGSSVRCCGECQRLFARSDWEALAHRWLHARPEDWVGDVAAYLEGTRAQKRPDFWPVPVGGPALRPDPSDPG